MTLSPDTHIVNIDAESNGLGGRAFQVAVLWTGPHGGVASGRIWQCPITPDWYRYRHSAGICPWVEDNVLPHIRAYDVDCTNYESMIANIFDWWVGRNGPGQRLASRQAIALAHVQWPVEARLLLDVFGTMHARPDLPAIPDVSHGPFPLYDVSSLLLAAGWEEPRDCGGYLAAQGLDARARMIAAGFDDDIAVPHNPLYDCFAADTAARHLLGLPVGNLEGSK